MTRQLITIAEVSNELCLSCVRGIIVDEEGGLKTGSFENVKNSHTGKQSG